MVIDETTGQQIGLSSTLNMSNLVGLDYSFIFEIVREYLSLELSFLNPLLDSFLSFLVNLVMNPVLNILLDPY